MRAALFPISPGRERFSTESTLRALIAIPAHYDEIVFLLADRLQMYNLALKNYDTKPSSSVLESIESSNDFRVQRKNWLARITSQMQKTIPTTRWKFATVDDVADADYIKICRRVIIAYFTCHLFRAAVDQSALQHVTNRFRPNHTLACELSCAYILEEVALSIRQHVFSGIRDEFYIGTHMPLIIDLYAGRLGIKVSSLAGVAESECDYRFYSWSPLSGGGHWQLVM